MPSPSRTPVFILSLIVTMLILSVSAVCLIVLFNANRPDTETLANACKAEVGSAIKIEADRVAKACENAVPDSGKIDGNKWRPGFIYKTGLQITGDFVDPNVKNPANASYVVSIRKAPFLMNCYGCDGYMQPNVTIAYEQGESLTRYPAELLAVITGKAEPSEKIPAKKEVINGANVLVINSAYINEFSGGSVKQEDIYFTKNGKIVRVTNYAEDSYGLSADDWQMIRSSLDFSKIE